MRSCRHQPVFAFLSGTKSTSIDGAPIATAHLNNPCSPSTIIWSSPSISPSWRGLATCADGSSATPAIISAGAARCSGGWRARTAFMCQFSAWTFTGAASKAYEDGPLIMVLFFANAVGFFFNAAFFAPALPSDAYDHIAAGRPGALRQGQRTVLHLGAASPGHSVCRHLAQRSVGLHFGRLQRGSGLPPSSSSAPWS